MTPLHSQILTARDRNGQELRTIQNQLQKLPPGKLICSRNGTTVKWSQGDGHSKTYIPKANRTLAEQLALKKYLQQQEQILLQEQAAITAYLKYSPAGSLSSDDPHLLSDPACEDLLHSYFSTSKNIPDVSNVSDISDISTSSAVEWSAASYERNPLHPEQRLHKTVSGERVRSKSEAIIAMLLHLNAIPYRYECALSLGGVTLFPDFTIRHPVTGVLYYWEHFGLMDDPAYAKNAGSKLSLYAANGIIPSVHLITTYETKAYPLNAGMIEHLISYYFLDSAVRIRASLFHCHFLLFVRFSGLERRFSSLRPENHNISDL